MYNKNNTGPMTEPCGTPEVTLTHVECDPLRETSPKGCCTIPINFVFPVLKNTHPKYQMVLSTFSFRLWAQLICCNYTLPGDSSQSKMMSKGIVRSKDCLIRLFFSQKQNKNKNKTKKNQKTKNKKTKNKKHNNNNKKFQVILCFKLVGEPLRPV